MPTKFLAVGLVAVQYDYHYLRVTLGHSSFVRFFWITFVVLHWFKRTSFSFRYSYLCKK